MKNISCSGGKPYVSIRNNYAQISLLEWQLYILKQAFLFVGNNKIIDEKNKMYMNIIHFDKPIRFGKTVIINSTPEKKKIL